MVTLSTPHLLYPTFRRAHFDDRHEKQLLQTFCQHTLGCLVCNVDDATSPHRGDSPYLHTRRDKCQQMRQIQQNLMDKKATTLGSSLLPASSLPKVSRDSCSVTPRMVKRKWAVNSHYGILPLQRFLIVGSFGHIKAALVQQMLPFVGTPGPSSQG